MAGVCVGGGGGNLRPQGLSLLHRQPLKLLDEAAFKVLQQENGLSRLPGTRRAAHSVDVLRPV